MDGTECVFMFVCLAIGRLGEGAKGVELEEEKRGACLDACLKFYVSCHYVWTLTDHRLSKRERDAKRKTRRWRVRGQETETLISLGKEEEE